jgi:hypothetical protein
LHSSDTGGKKWDYSEILHELFIDFKKAYDLFKREVLYSILIEYEVPTKLVKKNSRALVHQQTIPTERLPLVGKVSANFSR